jgi:hypothetical protein
VAARPGAANASERFDWLAIEEEAMSIARLELDRASWAAWCDEDDELRACDRFDDACLWAWQAQLRATGRACRSCWRTSTPTCSTRPR